MEKMKFYPFEVHMDKAQPTYVFFSKIPWDNETVSKENTHYILKNHELNEKFLWCYFEFGKDKPYSEDVYDAVEKKILKNKRGKNTAELINQLFCIYIFDTKELYLSNIQKQKVFIDLIEKASEGLSVGLKKIMKGPDDFFALLSGLNEVKLAVKEHILSEKKELFHNIKDKYGRGSQDIFDLVFKYNTHSKKTLKWVKNLLTDPSKPEIVGATVIGKDDKGIEKILNCDEFMNFVTIDIEKKDNGMFDDREVKEKVLGVLL